MERKSKVIDKVDEKISSFSSKASSKFHKSLLQQNNPLNTLNDIHNQFAVTPINKANENIAFIWQRFYVLVLIKDLSLHHNNTHTNKTYIPVRKTITSLATLHF